MWKGGLILGYQTTLLKIVAILWVPLSMATSFNTSSQIITRSPNCTEKCGSVNVPYPFGIEDGCYYVDTPGSTYYRLNCSNTTSPPTLIHGTNIQVVNITLDGEIRILSYISYDCYGYSDFPIQSSNWISFRKFTLSTAKNSLVAIGCDTYVWFNGTSNRYTTPFQSGCTTLCNKEQVDISDDTCSGIGCCKAFLPSGMNTITTIAKSYNNHSNVIDFNPCSVSFVVANDAMPSYRNLLPKNATYFINRMYPMVYSWSVGTKDCKAAKADKDYVCHGYSTCLDLKDQVGYRCQCSPGFQGNPYLDDCHDVDECVEENMNICVKPALCVNTIGGYNCSCPQGYSGNGTNFDYCIPNYHDRNKLIIGSVAGLMLLCGNISCIYIWIKRRRQIKKKEKFFLQNGGLLLKQRLTSSQDSNDTAKIYTNRELREATNNYSNQNILGQGGFGTVYKGTLRSNLVVAIKKSKLSDVSQVEIFINEVVILTQINHQNVVKLLGCCLETEVPLLVYEYVPNGTLFDHIHKEGERWLTWEHSIRIGSEAANAIAYLHSPASMPIIHRDIKSSNILLDENFTAKVADFGVSRLVPFDQSQVTTLVQGTLGYLDPEYFLTSHLSEKSDVYSFGVVLVELLTRRKPLLCESGFEERNLAMHFIRAKKCNNLFEILECHLMKEASKEHLIAIAELIEKCLSVKGEDRPSMKDVARVLQGLKNQVQDLGHNQNNVNQRFIS